MKKYWKWLLLVIVIIIAVVGVIFYRRDSNGKPFNASLNHEKVMMTPDWKATVKLTANKGATYEVENAKDKVVQGKTQTQNGKANIILNKVGNYTIIAKSDNGHVSKKLPVKVIHYKANINKSTSAVGPLKFKITTVEYKEITKGKKNNTDFSNSVFNELNKHYYQVKINYIVSNDGKKAVDPQYTSWLPVDDEGVEYPWVDGSADAVQDDNITGTSAVQPHSSRAGEVVMVSNRKLSVQHLRFNIDEVLGNNGQHISKGGTAKLK